MSFNTFLLITFPFVLLIICMVVYLFHRSATSSGEQGLDYKQFAYSIKRIAQAITQKSAPLNKRVMKERFAKLRPSDTIIGCTGCYVILTSILDYISGGLTIYWYKILQFFIGIWLIGYGMASKRNIRPWKIGRCWLVCTIFCLPVNVFWHWYYVQNLQFALTLSVAHLSTTLFILPLYISIKLVGFTLLVIFYEIYKIGIEQLITSGDSLLSILGFGLIVFSIIIYNKRKIAAYKLHNHYLKSQVNLATQKHHKPIQATFKPDPAMPDKTPKEEESFVEKSMQEVTELISYLDKIPFYKQDQQNIINHFFTFTAFLKQRAKSTAHILLTPNEIAIDELIFKLKTTLEAQASLVPKLAVEIKDRTIPKKITCDINHMIQALVHIVLRTANSNVSKGEIVRIHLYTTCLKYADKNAQKGKSHSATNFPAIALMVSNATTPLTILPQIKSYYEDITEGRTLKWHSSQKTSERVHVEKRIIERAVRAHYGYLRFPVSEKSSMLMVLPCNVTAVRDAMMAKILPLHVPSAQKEIDQSMEVFMQAYNHLLETSKARKSVIDEILLLTKRCYGFRRHLSGQLLYIRAIGIAQLVADWIRLHPEPIYVSLLYDLVHYANLPLSYIKANYDLTIYSFIESILAVNNRQSMEPCGLYIGNDFKQVINREQLYVLYIKLAERLYDLRHAKNYTHLDELKYMAQETLSVDIGLAKKYLNTKVVEALSSAAEQAIQVCKNK